MFGVAVNDGVVPPTNTVPAEPATEETTPDVLINAPLEKPVNVKPVNAGVLVQAGNPLETVRIEPLDPMPSLCGTDGIPPTQFAWAYIMSPAVVMQLNSYNEIDDTLPDASLVRSPWVVSWEKFNTPYTVVVVLLTLKLLVPVLPATT